MQEGEEGNDKEEEETEEEEEEEEMEGKVVPSDLLIEFLKKTFFQ